MFTLEYLKQRLSILEKGKREAQAKYNVIAGQEQEIKMMIEALEESTKVTGPKVTTLHPVENEQAQ